MTFNDSGLFQKNNEQKPVGGLASSILLSFSPCWVLARIQAGRVLHYMQLVSCAYFFNLCRRIHAESSKVLEIIEISSHQDLHRRGLHLLFEEDLTTFACVVPSQVWFSHLIAYTYLTEWVLLGVVPHHHSPPWWLEVPDLRFPHTGPREMVTLKTYDLIWMVEVITLLSRSCHGLKDSSVSYQEWNSDKVLN